MCTTSDHMPQWSKTGNGCCDLTLFVPKLHASLTWGALMWKLWHVYKFSFLAYKSLFQHHMKVMYIHVAAATLTGNPQLRFSWLLIVDSPSREGCVGAWLNICTAFTFCSSFHLSLWAVHGSRQRVQQPLCWMMWSWHHASALHFALHSTCLVLFWLLNWYLRTSCIALSPQNCSGQYPV